MTDRKFIDELIRVTNEYRAIHQAEPLKHNAVISTVSQSWADRIARTGSMEHNPNRSFNGQPLGENIAMKWSSDKQDYTGKEPVDQWYNEIKDYDFKRHSGSGTGHFTQLVWKSSREIGVGRAQSRDGKWFVVTNYFPPGNYVGRDAENVLPPRDGRIPVARGAAVGVARGATPTAAAKETARPAVIAPAITPSGVSPWNRTQPVQSKSTPSEQTTRVTPTATTLVIQPRPSQTAAVIERKQESRTKNGITTTIVTETRREKDGRVKTVTTETVEPSSSRGGAPAAAAAGGGASLGLKEVSLHFNAFNLTDSDPPHRLRASTTVLQRVACSDRALSGSGPPRSDDSRGSPSVMVSPSSDRDFYSQVVRQHNVYRRKHGNTGDLTLSGDLCKLAERWARHLACIGRLQHSDAKHDKTGELLGENIAYKYSSLKEDYTGEEVVSQWYDEIKQFNFRNPESSVESCGHFTQVVWKGSHEIGVGRAFAEGGLRIFVVCNYFPAGNVMGRFKDNVFPSK